MTTLREIDATLQAALAADRVLPFCLVEALFDSGAFRVWSGLGDLSALGYTWAGVGSLLDIGQIEEASDGRAVGLQIGLSGIPSAMVSIALAEEYQGRAARVYLGAFDAATGAIAGEPLLIFAGQVDTMPINSGAETARIVASIESRMLRLEQAPRRRYTAAEQRAAHPGDGGLDHVTAIQDIQIVWGQASPGGAGAGSLGVQSSPLIGNDR